MPVALAAFAGALHACVVRDYNERYPLTSLCMPSANARRLLWALVLLVPIVGVITYLAWYMHLPDPSDVNPRGVQNSDAAGFHILWHGRSARSKNAEKGRVRSHRSFQP